MNTPTGMTTQGVWKSLVTDRPDTKRKILCAYHTSGGHGWLWDVCIYYPDLHRVFVRGEPWFGDMIKRKNVHWMDLPLSPDGEIASVID